MYLCNIFLYWSEKRQLWEEEISWRGNEPGSPVSKAVSLTSVARAGNHKSFFSSGDGTFASKTEPLQQGDQIGWAFDYRVIVYFGHYWKFQT
jgi:hypothetical protein